METKQPLELPGTYLTSRWMVDGFAGQSNLLFERKSTPLCGPSRPSAPRGAAEQGEENKTSAETAAGIAFHEVVNRQRREGSPWPFASSQSRSSPRAFTGFDERAPSRCVNHEPLRRFFESHPLTGETEPKRRRRDPTEKRILFTSTDTYAESSRKRERRHSVSSQILCAPLQFHCRITSFKASSETPSDFPKTAHESDFCFPRVLPFCSYLL